MGLRLEKISRPLRRVALRGAAECYSRFASIKRRTPATVVLMYHNVGCEPEDRGTISTDELSAQWDWLLRRGYRNVSLDQIGTELAAGRLAEERRFAITFDDGRGGVYRNALPLLQSFGFTSTVYLVPGFLGQTRWFSYRRAGWITEEEGRSGEGLRLNYMSLDETRLWMEAGQSVGSHSMTHQHLAALGASDLEREILRFSPQPGIAALRRECL